MDQGAVIADGDPKAVMRDPAVVTAYLGGPGDDHEPGPDRSWVRGLEVAFGKAKVLDGVDLHVDRRDARRRRAQRSRQDHAAARAVAPQRRHVRRGRARRPAAPALAVRRGHGGAGALPGAQAAVPRADGAGQPRARGAAAAQVAGHQAGGPRPRLHAVPEARGAAGQAAGTLSGGEQQQCAIGRGLMARPPCCCSTSRRSGSRSG